MAVRALSLDAIRFANSMRGRSALHTSARPLSPVAEADRLSALLCLGAQLVAGDCVWDRFPRQVSRSSGRRGCSCQQDFTRLPVQSDRTVLDTVRYDDELSGFDDLFAITQLHEQAPTVNKEEFIVLRSK